MSKILCLLLRAACCCAYYVLAPFLSHSLSHLRACTGAKITDCEQNDPEALLTNATLRYLSNLEPGRPFFIAMGHHKPHLPWVAPARFFDQYGDPTQYPVAKQQNYPETVRKSPLC